jgi:hypothetical protein
LPDLVEVNVAVVVGNDVAHAAHGAEGQLRKERLSLRGEAAGGFADDFKARSTASCFSVFAMKVSRVTPLS